MGVIFVLEEGVRVLVLLIWILMFFFVIVFCNIDVLYVNDVLCFFVFVCEKV